MKGAPDDTHASVLTQTTIAQFHNNFSPGGEQPEHSKLAHEL